MSTSEFTLQEVSAPKFGRKHRQSQDCILPHMWTTYARGSNKYNLGSFVQVTCNWAAGGANFFRHTATVTMPPATKKNSWNCSHHRFVSVLQSVIQPFGPQEAASMSPGRTVVPKRRTDNYTMGSMIYKLISDPLPCLALLEMPEPHFTDICLKGCFSVR